VTATGGKYRLTHELEIRPAIIPPVDYGKLLQVESTLREKSGRAFLLQNTAGATGSSPVSISTATSATIPAAN
jgi:hypothetical protein